MILTISKFLMVGVIGQAVVWLEPGGSLAFDE